MDWRKAWEAALDPRDTKLLYSCKQAEQQIASSGQENPHNNIVVECNATYNELGMIYHIAEVPSEGHNKRFALASNNGVGIMNFDTTKDKNGKVKGPAKALAKTFL